MADRRLEKVLNSMEVAIALIKKREPKVLRTQNAIQGDAATEYPRRH